MTVETFGQIDCLINNAGWRKLVTVKYLLFLHTGKGYLRFYPEIIFFIISMLFLSGCHVSTVHWLLAHLVVKIRHCHVKVTFVYSVTSQRIQELL